MIASINSYLSNSRELHRVLTVKMKTFGGHVPRNHQTWNEQKADVMQHSN